MYGKKDKMHQLGEVVIYTTYGICKIKEFRELTLGGVTKRYYVLMPLGEEKTELTVPIDNPITALRVHKLLSADEVTTILGQIASMEPYWIENENERKKEFSDIIKNGNRFETLRLIKSIRYHQIEIKDKNRKLHVCDETSMKEAEKLIFDEFSYVLNKNKSEIIDLINLEIANSLEEKSA